MSTPKKARPLPLSCLTCHRRKVRCDRVKPSCGRCNAGGSVCVYPSGGRPLGGRPPRDTANIHSSSSGRRPIAEADAPAITNHAPLSVLPSPQTPRSATTTHNDSVADGSAAKVRELERKMIQLENLLKRPRDSMDEANSSFIDSSFAEQDHSLTGDAPSAKRQTREESTVKGLLAGKGFKTKYYGASNASSLLAEVSNSALQ